MLSAGCGAPQSYRPLQMQSSRLQAGDQQSVCVQVVHLVTASVDRQGSAAAVAARFDKAALAVLRLVVACMQSASGSHAVCAEGAAFLDVHSPGLQRILHNAGSGVHRCWHTTDLVHCHLTGCSCRCSV